MGSGIAAGPGTGPAHQTSFMSPFVNNSGFGSDGGGAAETMGADYVGGRMMQEFQNEIARLRNQNNHLMF